MEQLKIGIIGLGDMGTAHMRGFSALKNARVAAICDPDETARKRGRIDSVTEQIHEYADFKNMLNSEKLDAVVIAVPGYLHEEVLLECLDKNLDVFLEKPAAVTLSSLEKMRRHVQASSRLVQIGLVYRYSRLYRSIAEKLNTEKLAGNVTMAWCKEFRQCFPPADWFYDMEKSGGAIVEKDCHHFDIFNWMIGSRPKRVFAMGGQHVYKKGKDCVIDCDYSYMKPKSMNNIDIVDHAYVTVEYENGAKASLGLCMYLKPRNMSGDGLEIGFIGDEGGQLIARRDECYSISGGSMGENAVYEVDPESDGKEFGHIGCQTQRQEFLDCIVQRKEPCANIENTTDSLLIAFAAERSIQEDRVVSIAELEKEMADMDNERD